MTYKIIMANLKCEGMVNGMVHAVIKIGGRTHLTLRDAIVSSFVEPKYILKLNKIN